MRNLSKADLANVALVCRRWLPQARWELYHELYFDTDSPHAPHLSKIMRSSDLLRSLVRRLHISHFRFSQSSPTLLDWIALLPEHSLQLLETRMLMFDEAAAPSVVILEYSAIRTVPHLFLRSPHFFNMKRLNQVLHFQHLESLSIVIDQDSEVPSLPDCCMPKLKRLSLGVHEYGVTVSRILGGLAWPLERFNLKGNSLHPHNVAMLCHDLQRHLSTLRSASFVFHYAPASPFLDELVPSMRSLENLGCGVKTYTEQLMGHLPGTLVSLTLYTEFREAFPGTKYAELVQQYAPSALTKLTIADTRHYRQSEACVARADACSERRVTFKIVDQGTVDFCAEDSTEH